MTPHQKRFGAAARACKPARKHGRRAFGNCIRRKLKRK